MHPIPANTQSTSQPGQCPQPHAAATDESVSFKQAKGPSSTSSGGDGGKEDGAAACRQARSALRRANINTQELLAYVRDEKRGLAEALRTPSDRFDKMVKLGLTPSQYADRVANALTTMMEDGCLVQQPGECGSSRRINCMRGAADLFPRLPSMRCGSAGLALPRCTKL